MATNNGSSYLPITWADLDAYLLKWADPTLRAVSWKPAKQLRREGKALAPLPVVGDLQSTDTLSLLDLAREISGNGSLLNPDVNRVMNAIRDGLCIGLHLADAYAKRSGLDSLQEQNRLGKLSPAQLGEFNSKGSMRSAIAIFAASSYIVSDLSIYESGKVAGIKVDFGGVPETSLSQGPQKALMCLLYHFACYCKQESGVVTNGLELVKLALLYFEAAMDEIHDKEGSFQFREPFTEASYKLEQSDFVVRGFDLVKRGATVSAEFKKVGFEEIVGNRRAKHQAKRTAMMICCYDPVRKKNPFLELGSFPMVRMGYGVPGTGKSLQIAATATLIQELCDRLGLPFLFWPMPATIVSTFQGGSAERMEDWMRRLTEDDKIVYGSVDDAENNLMNRSKEGVSAGVREVISVFLRNTEGASAIVRGNTVIELFTNLPELVDPAVLSRVQARFPIDGARTWEDFVDQGHLWLRRYGSLDEGFVSFSNEKGYEFLSAQKGITNLAELESAVGAYQVKDAKILRAIEIAGKKFPRTDHGFFAELYYQVQQDYPAFSSRDVRNIQSAVDGRILDFDLPKEWFDDPKLFYGLDYDTKVKMLKVELKKNMKGLNIQKILIEEAFRYLDVLAQISSVEFEREVTATVSRARVVEEAKRRILATATA